MLPQILVDRHFPEMAKLLSSPFNIPFLKHLHFGFLRILSNFIIRILLIEKLNFHWPQTSLLFMMEGLIRWTRHFYNQGSRKKNMSIGQIRQDQITVLLRSNHSQNQVRYLKTSGQRVQVSHMRVVQNFWRRVMILRPATCTKT